MDLINTLYALNAFILVFSYLPQIHNLINSTGKSKAISISSWVLWLYTASIATIYAHFVVGDLKFTMFSLTNVILCTIVIALTLYNRHYRFKDINHSRRATD